VDPSTEDDFRAFVIKNEPPLRRALVAYLGPDRGRDATAEALAWAWASWPKSASLGRPVAYLFRVGQSRTRRLRLRVVVERPSSQEPWCEPRLPAALARLSPRQRTAVVLVHGFGWTLREVAELLDVRVTTVQNHLERGLAHLRSSLEVEQDEEPQR
jgi:DNA-directed RNA polymerase specialized sigma24 family protein